MAIPRHWATFREQSADGITVDETSAARMIAARENDGSEPPEFPLPSSSAPGEWQLTADCPPAGGVFLHWRIASGDRDSGGRERWQRTNRPDPSYVPFLSTPCFPSYPSGHATSSYAAREVLERVFGRRGH